MHTYACCISCSLLEVSARFYKKCVKGRIRVRRVLTDIMPSCENIAMICNAYCAHLGMLTIVVVRVVNESGSKKCSVDNQAQISCLKLPT